MSERMCQYVQAHNASQNTLITRIWFSKLFDHNEFLSQKNKVVESPQTAKASPHSGPVYTLNWPLLVQLWTGSHHTSLEEASRYIVKVSIRRPARLCSWPAFLLHVLPSTAMNDVLTSPQNTYHIFSLVVPRCFKSTGASLPKFKTLLKTELFEHILFFILFYV